MPICSRKDSSMRGRSGQRFRARKSSRSPFRNCRKAISSSTTVIYRAKISCRSSTRSSLLAEDSVNYIGQPILLVVGPDKEVILEILDSIEVSYEAQHPIFSIEEAMVQEGNFIFGDKPYFVAYSYTKGNPEEAIRQAQSVVEDELPAIRSRPTLSRSPCWQSMRMTASRFTDRCSAPITSTML